MRKSSKALLVELARNKRLMGTCPACFDDFRLADADLFVIGDQPPDAALAAVSAMRRNIKERREEVVRRRELMTKRAELTAKAVNLGKMVEKIVPSFPSFTYPSGDCRALFEPIDYVVFSGLTKNAVVDALRFVDVKSGSARLTKTQRVIKYVVESGRVKFGVTRP